MSEIVHNWLPGVVLAVIIAAAWLVWERGRKIRFAEEGLLEPVGPRFVRAVVGIVALISVLFADYSGTRYYFASGARPSVAPAAVPATAVTEAPPHKMPPGAPSTKLTEIPPHEMPPGQYQSVENTAKDMLYWLKKADVARFKGDLEAVWKAERLARAFAADLAQYPKDVIEAALRRADEECQRTDRLFSPPHCR